MRKSKINLCFIFLGILAAMLFLIVPSVTLAGGGGMEGAYPACEDDPGEGIYFNTFGGPVYIGNVNAIFNSGLVLMTGFIAHGQKCALIFDAVPLLVGVPPGEWEALTAKELKGGRLEVQAGWAVGEDCVNAGSCMEITGVGNFKWANDEKTSFSAHFGLKPVE